MISATSNCVTEVAEFRVNQNILSIDELLVKQEFRFSRNSATFTRSYLLWYLQGLVDFWPSNNFDSPENQPFYVQKQSSGGVLYKKAFLEISQNSQENTCTGESFLINFVKFRTTPFFIEHLRWLLLYVKLFWYQQDYFRGYYFDICRVFFFALFFVLFFVFVLEWPFQLIFLFFFFK